MAGIDRRERVGVGLDTPGPATADGVISSKGGTNFAHGEWRGFDVRTALENELGLPVVYNNDANAAALYAHHRHFGAIGGERSSISAIVGTGLGGGVIESGRIIKGAAGMAGELGHVHIPMDGLLGEGQPTPTCNCGFVGDAESVASLTGIRKNLLPYWLTPLPRPRTRTASSIARRGEAGARLRRARRRDGAATSSSSRRWRSAVCSRSAANFTDPDVYLLGGGVIEAEPSFRDWFLARVERAHVPARRAAPGRVVRPRGRPRHGRRPRLRHRRVEPVGPSLIPSRTIGSDAVERSQDVVLGA